MVINSETIRTHQKWAYQIAGIVNNFLEILLLKYGTKSIIFYINLTDAFYLVN